MGNLVAIEGSDFKAQERSSELLHALQLADDQPGQVDEGKYGFAVEPWFGNFYHWIVFCAPRIALLHRLVGVSRFYFPRGAIQQGPYIAETFSMLGLGENSVVEVNAWRRCQSLYFVQGYRPNRFGFGLLQNCNAPVTNDQELSDRPVGYYLVRRSCTSHDRIVENEDDLIAFCIANGIVVLDPATLSLPAQVELFSKVRILIGAHGAALANMVWMPPNSFVLEIMHRKAPHYRMLAHQLRIRYIGIESYSCQTSAEGESRLIVNHRLFQEIVVMELAFLSRVAA
jgi:capsular polysaccharide biosynthesis protein